MKTLWVEYDYRCLQVNDYLVWKHTKGWIVQFILHAVTDEAFIELDFPTEEQAQDFFDTFIATIRADELLILSGVRVTNLYNLDYFYKQHKEKWGAGNT